MGPEEARILPIVGALVYIMVASAQLLSATDLVLMPRLELLLA
jgi:hypothetical protein